MISLYSVGVINLKPLRQIKDSRNLGTEPASTDTAKLFEVTDADAPNVLTNDPDYFVPKKNSSQGMYCVLMDIITLITF